MPQVSINIVQTSSFAKDNNFGGFDSLRQKGFFNNRKVLIKTDAKLKPSELRESDVTITLLDNCGRSISTKIVKWESEEAQTCVKQAAGDLLSIVNDQRVNISDLIEAAKALSQMDGYEEEAATALKFIATDPSEDKWDQIEAAKALSQMDGYEEDAANILKPIATDPSVDGWNRRVSASALGQMDGYEEDAANVLKSIATDLSVGGWERIKNIHTSTESWTQMKVIWTRIEAAWSLSKLDGYEEEAANILKSIATDPNLTTEIRIEAAKALGKMDGYEADAGNVLKSIAMDPNVKDGWYRNKAAEALNKMRKVGAWKSIAMDPNVKDGWYRIEATKALGPIVGYEADVGKARKSITTDRSVGGEMRTKTEAQVNQEEVEIIPKPSEEPSNPVVETKNEPTEDELQPLKFADAQKGLSKQEPKKVELKPSVSRLENCKQEKTERSLWVKALGFLETMGQQSSGDQFYRFYREAPEEVQKDIERSCSIYADFNPLLAIPKGFYETVTGTDLLTQNPSSRYLAALNLIPGSIIGQPGKLAKLAKIEARVSIEVKATDKLHKNSLKYKGETHVYKIVDSEGKVHKVGESAQGYRKRDGASKRAEVQVRKLRKETGKRFKSKVIGKHESKEAAKNKETDLIVRTRKLFGNKALPGNKGIH